MTLTRNPLAPSNSLPRTSGSTQKYQDERSPSTRGSTRSTYGLGTGWFRSQPAVGYIVAIEGIDPDIPLKNIFSQVRGGAIESASRSYDMLIIQFIDRVAAQNFYAYARQGQFVIEGNPVCVSVPTPSQRERGSEYAKALSRGARRVLKISRRVDVRPSGVLYSKINMTNLESVFEITGQIVSLQPMFSKGEVAFQIMYENIASAIRAKRLFDSRSPIFGAFLGWTLSFSSDPAESSCYVPP